MMKLAFCLFNYFPYGGLQRDFMRVAQLASQHGHEVHVYTMQFRGERPRGFIIHELPPSKFCLQHHTRIQEFVTRTLERTNGQYDLVIGFNKMPGLDIYFAADGCFAEKLRGKPFTFLQKQLPRNKTYLALEKTVFTSGYTHILHIAKQSQQAYQKYYSVPPERETLLPPGIDPLFKSLQKKEQVTYALRETLHIPQKALVILMVASRFKTKGLDRAVRAIASLPFLLQESVRFIVIGDDKKQPFLRLAEKCLLKSEIHYVGAQENIADWMQTADLLLHPAYHESAGLTLLEAIAAELPILTTANCGYADYVKKAEAGCVVAHPVQQHALNQALSSMLSSKDNLTHYSQNAYQYAKHADFYSMPQAFLKIIETIGAKDANICA